MDTLLKAVEKAKNLQYDSLSVHTIEMAESLQPMPGDRIRVYWSTNQDDFNDGYLISCGRIPECEFDNFIVHFPDASGPSDMEKYQMYSLLYDLIQNESVVMFHIINKFSELI